MRALPRLLAWAITGACLLAAPARAAEQISASHRAAAEQLLELMAPEQSMRGGAAAMTDAMIASNPGLAPYRDVVLDWASRYLTWEVIGPQMAALYADAFTESELRDLIRFYQTPTGQKTVRLMPELTSKGAMIGQQAAEQHIEELDAAIRKRAGELEATGATP